MRLRSRSPHTRRRLRLVLLLAAAPALGGRLAADTPPSAPPPTRTPIVETVSSELVLIETYATDGRGHPVTDLTRDDFILEVGGLRRPILSAEFHRTAATPLQPTAASAGAGPATATAPAGSDWPRRFVIFIDDNTSGSSGVLAARRAAERFLESGLAPTDQVAIAACEPPLRMVHDFTTDRAALRRSLEADIMSARRSTNFYTEMTDVLETINLGSTHSIQSACELLEARWAGTLKSVQVIAESLAAWRGYKAIVLMGDGVPEYPMDPIYKWLQRFALRNPGDPAMFQLTCTLDTELKDLSRAAGASGVTLHTIETRGLQAVASASGGTQAFLTLNSLRMLAETTGGTASTSNDFLAAFKAIDRASRDFYILAYVPQEPADGKFRHLVVRCRRKGVSLRFRKGFVRLPPAEARVRSIEAAHLFPEMHADSMLTLDAVDGPADAGGRTVDLVLHLPAGDLLFQPGPDGPTARLSLGVVALTGGGHDTLRFARRVAIRRTADASASFEGINWTSRVRLPLAAQSITAVVHDETSGWIGAARLDLEADPAPRRALLGLSLYAVGENSLWLDLPSDSDDDAPEIAVAARTTGPGSRTSFAPGEAIVAAFRPAPGPSPGGGFRLDILRDGVIVRSLPIVLEGAADARPAKLPLPVAGLAAGDYRLSIFQVFDDHAVERAVKPFRIVEPAAAAPESPPSP